MRTKKENANFRNFLNKLIEKITDEIPENDKIKIDRLLKIKDTLFHRAPEILNNSFLDILSFLRGNIVLLEDDSKNPQYVKNIKTIWADACIKFKNGFEASEKED